MVESVPNSVMHQGDWGSFMTAQACIHSISAKTETVETVETVETFEKRELLDISMPDLKLS